MAHTGLIVALGNPGRKYARTRHNFGFMAADTLIAAADKGRQGRVHELRSLDNAVLWEWSPQPHGESWLLLKPMTYMNRSGEALRLVVRKHGFDPDDILVLHDELDLVFGRVQFKSGGGLAGHKGLKSIAQVLASRDFHRVRLGIGRPENGTTVTEYVLQSFDVNETKALPKVLEGVEEGVRRYCLEGADRATQFLNAFNFVQ